MRLKYCMRERYICGAPLRYEWDDYEWVYVYYKKLSPLEWWNEMLLDLRKRCSNT